MRHTLNPQSIMFPTVMPGQVWLLDDIEMLKFLNRHEMNLELRPK